MTVHKSCPGGCLIHKVSDKVLREDVSEQKDADASTFSPGEGQCRQPYAPLHVESRILAVGTRPSALQRRSTSEPHSAASDNNPGDVSQPASDKQSQPKPSPPQLSSSSSSSSSSLTPDAKLSPEEQAHIKELRADRTEYKIRYLGADKAALRAELRALPPTDPRRREWERLKGRYAALRYWEATGRLRAPELDPTHPLNALRARLRHELASLPPRQLRALENAHRREFGGHAPHSRAARQRVLALPLDHAERQRYERLYAAARLVSARASARMRSAARAKKQRDAFERRYLGPRNAAKRAALERGQGSARALQAYGRLKRAYEQWQAAQRGVRGADGKRVRPPRKPLPADIPAALAALRPSKREWTRLQLGYKAKRNAFLAGDDRHNTRRRIYEQLHADAVEYDRLMRWLKKGYTSGDSVPSVLADWDGVGDGALEEDEVGGLSSSASASPAATDNDVDGSVVEENDTRESRAGVALGRGGLPLVRDLWRRLTVPFSSAAGRIHDFGRSFAARDATAQSLRPPARAYPLSPKVVGGLRPL